MKRFFLFFLTLIPSIAHADWSFATQSEDGDVTYVEKSYIVRNGNLVKMWEMTNLKSAGVIAGKAFMSWKVLVEFDCAQKKSRRLDMIFFSGAKGSGEMTYKLYEPGTWGYVSPGSMGEATFKIACSKK